jgi:hypothetical protein
MTLGPDLLEGQFALARSAEVLPPSWPRRQAAGWTLACHPTLPVTDILGSDSALAGWLIGYPIGPDGRRATGSVQFPLVAERTPAVRAVAGSMVSAAAERAAAERTPVGGASSAATSAAASAAKFAATFEATLYEYGGRFAAVMLGGRVGRLYLDAAGSLAAVYCPTHRMAASTPSLIPQGGDCGDAIIPEIAALGSEGSYPFGLTPRRNVERLMPNHFLDLESWQAARHWPAGEIAATGDPRQTVAEVAALVGRHIAAMAEGGPLHMSLTAGRDTRMMLACAREHVGRIAFYTVWLPNEPAKLDCQVAPKIARRLRLRHTTLRLADASEADAAEWCWRTGGAVAGVHPQMLRTMEQLDPERPLLLGTGGELARKFHWRAGDTESSPVTAEDLLAKLQIPRAAAVVERAARWRAGLPVASAITIWGLLNIEQQLGCWAAPLYYGYRRGGFCLLPFAHRGIFERILSLPVEYRRDGGVEKDLIGGRWPELLAWPFNWPLGIRGYMYSIQWRVEALRRRLAGR